MIVSLISLYAESAAVREVGAKLVEGVVADEGSHRELRNGQKWIGRYGWPAYGWGRYWGGGWNNWLGGSYWNMGWYPGWSGAYNYFPGWGYWPAFGANVGACRSACGLQNQFGVGFCNSYFC